MSLVITGCLAGTAVPAAGASSSTPTSTQTSPQTTQTQPAPPPTTTTPATTTPQSPVSAATPTFVHVLLAPAVVDKSALEALAAELRQALASHAIVVLRVPVSTKLDVKPSPALSNELKAAGHDARFAIVWEGGDFRRDDAATTLERFTDVQFRTSDAKPPAGTKADVLKSDQDLLHRFNASHTPVTTLRGDLGSSGLGDALFATGGKGAGGFPILALVLALLLLAAGFAAFRFLRARPRGQGGGTGTGPGPTPPRRPVAAPRSRGGGRPAVVHSTLHPEGYVALGEALVRVRWAASSPDTSVPGQRVEVEEQNGRLWAYPIGGARGADLGAGGRNHS